MNKTYYTILIFFYLLISICQKGIAQGNKLNTYNVLTINATYGIHLPGGDMNKRFGGNFSLGGGIDFINEKNNFIIGLKGNNLFGNTVKEDVLANLRDSEGFILGSVGGGRATYAEVFLRERGWYAGGHFGKLFSISQKNKRSGIRLTFGLGILQHKIRIQDETGAADQLKGDLINGYDRLSNGLSFEQFIGYQQLNRKTGINFLAGFELTEGFIKNRRAANFATQTTEFKQRFDVLLGFRVGWLITLYVGERAEDIRY